MADSSRDVEINIKLKQSDTALKAPDLSPATKSVKEYEKSIEDAGKTAKEYGIKVAEANLRAGDSFKLAGEGAFTMARGMVAIGVSNEDMEKIVQTMAKMQGAFDLAKGAFDVYKGLTQGIRAMQTATEAAAVAQSAMAVANTAEAATAETAAAANVTLQASLGPIGWILAGVTVAVGALAYAWSSFSKELKVNEIEKATNQLSDLAEQVDKFDDRIRSARNELVSVALMMAENDQKRMDVYKKEQEESVRNAITAKGNIFPADEKLKAKKAELDQLINNPDITKTTYVQKGDSVVPVVERIGRSDEQLKAIEEKKKEYKDALQARVTATKAYEEIESEIANREKEMLRLQIRINEALARKVEQADEDRDTSLISGEDNPALLLAQENERAGKEAATAIAESYKNLVTNLVQVQQTIDKLEGDLKK